MKAASKSLGMDFTVGPIMPLMLRFMLPFLAANLLNSLYNTVDTIIIGQFLGSASIVAVSMGGKVLQFLTNISNAFAGAGQVLISQYIGARRRDELNSMIGTMFTQTLLFSVGFAVLTLVLAQPLLGWLNTPEESFAEAKAYLIITGLGAPLLFGYNAVSAVLRGMGDSKSPLVFIAIASVVNMVLDIVFIAAFDMGVAGAALATVIGQGVSLAFSIVLMYKRREGVGFDFRLASFRPDREKFALIMRLGLPLALRTCCINFTQMFMLSFVNGFGVVQAAAYNVADKFMHIAFVFILCGKQASGAMVAQNVGAGNLERVKKIVKSVAALMFSTTAVLVIISVLFPRQIFMIFTHDEAVLAYAREFVYISCLTYIIMSAVMPFEGVLAGTGNAPLEFLGGILDGVVCRIGFSLLFGLYFNMGAAGFFLGDALARLGVLAVGAVYYYSGAWKKYKIIKD